MATVRSLLGIICLIVCGGFVEPSGDFLAEKGLNVNSVNRLIVGYVELVGIEERQSSIENLLSVAKSKRQSSVPVKSKKQQYNRAISTDKPQTQWFCVNDFTAFNFSVANKTKCQCFFDAGGFVKRHLRVIDKHFCILFMPKKFDALRHRANDKFQYSNAFPQLTSYTINQRYISDDFSSFRSLPRGQFHFSLTKNETKSQVRNEASTLISNTWPAVPVCPTLFGSVYNGLKLCRNIMKMQHDKLNANNNTYVDGIVRVNRQLNNSAIEQLNNPKQLNQRNSILAIARTQLGTREATGKNDGVAVEAYLSYTGNTKGTPWCASFISWVYGKAGLVQPRSAWSPALFPKNRQTLKPLPADVFGIYFQSLKRIAHCGIVEVSKGNWLQTIEGNTNSTGAREGDGVYRKLRHKRTIALYANWINELKKGEPK